MVEGVIRAIAPSVLVCLGATAAKALLGREFKVSVSRGKFVENPYAPYAFATYHPSALLRMRDEGREIAFRQLVKDLSLIREALG